MSIDTSRKITFSDSPWKLLFGVLIGLAMVGLSVYVFTLTTYRGREIPPIRMQTYGTIGVVFFGFCVMVVVGRMLNRRGGIVTLGPEGLRDIRIAPGFVPWSAIQEISTWGGGMSAVMVLSVRPETESALRLTPMARWTRGMNAKLGADGLCVASAGLATDYTTLLATTEAYWIAHR
ncbi:STM3941 family protein [Hyphomicrobium sp.]|uniref:STM3941 family protein n=1 Tax=Hyphomicrobium sp. TaxID=82 RepID=UPI002CEFF8BC|nr:STM3941 family protein [Hyphomicrobium sp.]HRQ26849.1 STM3941 family protein [Hyphomicrobium sp.]